jgi:hypothetical protein
MNTRHPNQQPEPRDTMDDVLDNLLNSADQDLHASLEPGLNVDAGLDAILGHRTTLPHKTQPSRITPKAARLSSSAKSHANRALSAVTSFLTWLTIITGVRSRIKIPWTSFETTVTDPGTHSVDEQITAVIRLVNRAYGFNLLRKIRDCQALRELQEGLAERRLSRTEADQLIGDVETKLRRTLMRNSHTWYWVAPLMIPLMSFGTSLINQTPVYEFLLFVSIATFLVFVCLDLIEEGRGIPPWRRKTAKLALTKLQQLRPAVNRLFDDTNDWSLNTSPR